MVEYESLSDMGQCSCCWLSLVSSQKGSRMLLRLQSWLALDDLRVRVEARCAWRSLSGSLGGWSAL